MSPVPSDRPYPDAVAAWPRELSGVVVLPSGRRVRGRSLRDRDPAGPDPTFGLYLLARRPAPTPWPATWVCWPDFGLPLRPGRTTDTVRDAWARAVGGRVEVACSGGTGRTGTVLAAMAVLDGLAPEAALAHVRAHYRPRAVETPWQRWYVRRFAAVRRRPACPPDRDPRGPCCGSDGDSAQRHR